MYFRILDVILKDMKLNAITVPICKLPHFLKMRIATKEGTVPTLNELGC